MKKIIEFIKKDWKETRIKFCVYAWYYGIMTMAISVSIITGQILVAFWQFFYTLIFTLLLESQKQTSFWRKETLKVLEEWRVSTGKVVNDTLDYINFIAKARKDGDEFAMVDDGKQKGIMCLTCLKTSYNEGDIINLYCAECDKFHKKADEKVKA